MKMKKLFGMGMMLLMLLPSVLAVNQTITGDNPFQYGVCPTDLFGFILYFGMGAFILAIVLICKKTIRVPFITIFTGVGFIIWSTMGLWGCSKAFGFIGIMFGVGLIAYEFISTVIK